MKRSRDTLNTEQQQALALLESGDNVFLTGGAGCGKSYLLQAFTRRCSQEKMPVLASTGVAAIAIGGRTFHSFFGLGLMEGSADTIIARASNDKRLLRRLSQIEGFVLDEVSMISSEVLEVANEIAKMARDSRLPWGGLRVIMVGDFAQLPPVTKQGSLRWGFTSSVWKESCFQNCVLTHNHRVKDQDYLHRLSEIRRGQWTSEVVEFLNEHVYEHDLKDKHTRLFPLRAQAERYNLVELNNLPAPAITINSIYTGDSRYAEALQKQAPVPKQLILKKGAQVLFIQNDPKKKWVNGTRGTIVDIEPDGIIVEKKNSHSTMLRSQKVTVEKTSFSMHNADGAVVASVLNYPLTLAYASTIHKSQGATLDGLWVDLSQLWEPGHAYVALSRLRTSQGLKILRWSQRSFIVDPLVNEFYENLI